MDGIYSASSDDDQQQQQRGRDGDGERKRERENGTNGDTMPLLFFTRSETPFVYECVCVFVFASGGVHSHTYMDVCL